MSDLAPFSPERLKAAFRAASDARQVRQRLELLAERAERFGATGRVSAALADELRRRTHGAAARFASTVDAELLLVLLLGPGGRPDPAPALQRRRDLHGQLRAVAEPAYDALLDHVAREAPPARLALWPLVEALARTLSIPPAPRRRILDYLHTLPGVILAPFPETSRRMESLRDPEPEDFEPVDERALEASAVVAVLVADRELPAEYLAALVPRALEFSDPLTRIRVAEHPRADADVWREFLRAASPVDRALAGRAAGAWRDPWLRERLRELGDAAALAPPVRAEVRLRLCRGAPPELARGWLPDVVRSAGLAALALLALDRPELGELVSEDDCERLREDPEVRAALGLDGGDGAALDELLGGPGAGFVRRLLGRRRP